MDSATEAPPAMLRRPAARCRNARRRPGLRRRMIGHVRPPTPAYGTDLGFAGKPTLTTSGLHRTDVPFP